MGMDAFYPVNMLYMSIMQSIMNSLDIRTPKIKKNLPKPETRKVDTCNNCAESVNVVKASKLVQMKLIT